MRIKDLPSSLSIAGKRTQHSTKSSSGGSLFASALNGKKAEFDNYDQEISSLRDEIDQAGDTLEQEPTLDNFNKFRDLLSRLAKRVNTEAYRLEKIGGTPLNPRYFEVIRVINEEADKLYKLILNEQRNRMAIIEKVIGIKGLVVNLVT